MSVPRPGSSGFGNYKTAPAPLTITKPPATTFGSRVSLNPAQQSRIQAKLKTLFNKQALKGNLSGSFKTASRVPPATSKILNAQINWRPPSTKLTPKFNLSSAATQKLRLRLASAQQRLANAKRLQARNAWDKSVLEKKRLFWGTWNDYPQVSQDGRLYAQINGRLYTRHAVDRMQPSGLGAPPGTETAGRSISPQFVEDVIQTGNRQSKTVDGVEREVFISGSVEVVTEQGGKIVVTVNPFKH